MEHFDVLIVGAGLSGIGAGAHLRMNCPGKTFAIFEGRGAMGGTWDLFRYPGVRSDSDMYTLGYRFRPWTDPKAIADGPAILNYIRETSAAYDLDKEIRYNRRVRRAEWSSKDAKWTVEVETGPRVNSPHVSKGSVNPKEPEPNGNDVATQAEIRPVGSVPLDNETTSQSPEAANPETIHFTCNFLYLCTGYYDYTAGYTPAWPGFDNYKGIVVHPQKWPEDLNYAGKNVLVIGSGATAVTLVPCRRVFVNDAAVLFEKLYRHRADARGSRDREALLHVLNYFLSGSCERFRFGIRRKRRSGFRCLRSGSGGRCRSRLRPAQRRTADRHGRSGRSCDCGAGAAVLHVREELAP